MSSCGKPLNCGSRSRRGALAEFRESLDEAEASIARGEGIEITMRQLGKDIMERCRARLEADRKTGR
jgi:hypothetical protein